MKWKCLRLLAVAILATGLLALATGCNNGITGNTTTTGGATSYTVKYEFTGTRSAQVTYFNKDDHETSTTVSPPWSYSFTTTDKTHGVKVAAFSLSSGSATVKLYVNGSLKKSGSDGNSYGFNATTGTYQIKDLL